MATEATQMEPTASSNTSQTQQLPNHKVKIKMPLQRACNEKNEKGKLCGGHLKRWFYAVDAVECACGDVESAWGKNAEVYRCGTCKTVYLPSEAEPKGKNVAGIGQITIVGLPTKKDEKPAVKDDKKA